MNRWGETLLGAAVALVAVGFFAFAAAQAGQSTGGGGYELSARFQRVNGVDIGSDVRVSGVKVGVVRSVSLDTNSFDAVLVMSIAPGVQVPDDSTASIASDGLLGGAYVNIEPGGGMDMLAAGAEIANTRGSIDLLTLFASFAQGGNNDDSSSQENAAP